MIILSANNDSLRVYKVIDGCPFSQEFGHVDQSVIVFNWMNYADLLLNLREGLGSCPKWYCRFFDNYFVAKLRVKKCSNSLDNLEKSAHIGWNSQTASVLTKITRNLYNSRMFLLGRCVNRDDYNVRFRNALGDIRGKLDVS